MLTVISRLFPILGLIATIGTAVAQQGTSQQPESQAQNIPSLSPQSVRPEYVLGPNDQMLIRVPQAEEINDKTFRVEPDGNVSLPLVGVMRASGLSLEDFEAALTKALTVYVHSPVVSVTVIQYRSDPIFLMGPFQRPGIYPLQGGARTLVDLLTTVGGLQPNTSRRIRISRRLDQGSIPLPSAVEDPEAKVSSVEIGLNRLMETSSPAENIVLKPFDIIRAFKAEMVFINMEGGKGGAFALDERDSLSVTQLLALAGGLGPGADAQNAVVLRPILDTSKRAEIPVNIKRILQGEANDFPLLPNDLLVIPQRRGRVAFLRPLMFVLPSLATGFIYAALRR